MIEAKVRNGSVSALTTGTVGDLIKESMVLMAAIRESIRKVNPDGAEVFKEAVDRLFEKGLVWESFEFGISQEDAE